ncbi:MAG: AAA family ATPase [Planctomycetaceae bacterium]|nr:AAA family ATPase [Planctomycetaceae bacterium]
MSATNQDLNADQKLQEILNRIKGRSASEATKATDAPVDSGRSQAAAPMANRTGTPNPARTTAPRPDNPTPAKPSANPVPVARKTELPIPPGSVLEGILKQNASKPKPVEITEVEAKEMANQGPIPVPTPVPNAPTNPEQSQSTGPQSTGPKERYVLTANTEEPFIPREPETLYETGLTETLLEELILRYLLARGEASGRHISDQIKLPFRLLDPILSRLKQEQLTTYRGATSINDYIHLITDAGRERARAYNHKTTYYGAAPVSLKEYIESVKHQSIEDQRPTEVDLRRAFSDLLVDSKLLERLGPAVNSGRGMFLFGYPGNGKTSIAERITSAFGKYIWIPRALLIDGEIIRLFDPMLHVLETPSQPHGWLNNSQIDQRWLRIRRPTVVAGGELTMSMLEITRNSESKINEAPMQMKSNCGVLLIDDFGRQRMSVDELLNRWIVPLEKRYDYLNMVSGKKTQVPFDQLVIFSTNLEPKDLVDEAFLRRIPYKIEVLDPSEESFRKLFEIMCQKLTIPYRPAVIDYLVEKYYKEAKRPFRNCHPRDLLMQVRNYCLYKTKPLDLLPEYFDYAAENYFSVM